MTLAIKQWNNSDQKIKLLSWLLIISLLIDVFSTMLAWLSIKSLFLGNIYLLIQFVFLYQNYCLYFKAKRTYQVILLVYLLLHIGYSIFIQGINAFSIIPIGVSSIILISFSLFFFWKTLIQDQTIRIQESPMVWITFSVLIYYSGTFCLFMYSNYFLLSPTKSTVLLWVLHNLLNITKNILFAVGLWKNFRLLKASSVLK